MDRFVRPAAVAAVTFLCTLCMAGSLLAAEPGLASAAGPDAGQTWTVALYINADNDLEYTWPRFTLPALRRIPPSPHVNVVALVDKQAADGAFLYRVEGKKVTTVRHFTKERDFGTGATFRWFLEQVHRRFPSDRLVVVGWDHGYGWRYFSRDESSGDHAITMPGLRAALAGAGVPIDILAFDACNMGDVEVAWDIASVDHPEDSGRPLVARLVASEETIDQDGYPYDVMFAPLAADPGRSPEQVADDMLRGWDAYYGCLRCFDWVSLTAVDLAAVRAAGPAMTDFTRRLRAGLVADPPGYGRAVRRAVASSLAAWDSWQQDLGMFAARLVDGHDLDDDAELVSAAAAVRDAVADMVTGVSNGSYVRWLRGLSVWIGTGNEWAEYRSAYRRRSLFGARPVDGGVGWYRLLRAYNASGQARRKLPEPSWRRATCGLTDVYFTDLRHGWATGYDNVVSESVVLRTTDGGRLWKTARPSDGGAYSADALAVTPSGRLWVVGGEGWDGALIARSADKGASWKYVPAPTLEYLLGVEAVSGRVGFAAGTRGVLLRTTDGARTWKKVKGAPAGDLLGMRFASASEGWVLANDRAGVTGTVRHTTDGATTWTEQLRTPGALLGAVDTVGPHIWVAGGDPAAGPVLAGERVSGAGVVLHSSDGGTTWETQWGGDAGDLRVNDLDMVDEQVGWAVGDATAAQKALVLRTTDGGGHWATLDPGDVYFDLTAVHALDARTAWVVGDGEEILATTDGGVTWTSTFGDVVGPVVRVDPVEVRRGRKASLRYTVKDARSPQARVTLRIRDGRGRVVKRRALGWRSTGPAAHVFSFRCRLPRGRYRVEALAVDRSGNRQSRMVAGRLIVR